MWEKLFCIHMFELVLLEHFYFKENVEYLIRQESAEIFHELKKRLRKTKSRREAFVKADNKVCLVCDEVLSPP